MSESKILSVRGETSNIFNHPFISYETMKNYITYEGFYRFSLAILRLLGITPQSIM